MLAALDTVPEQSQRKASESAGTARLKKVREDAGEWLLFIEILSKTQRPARNVEYSCAGAETPCRNLAYFEIGGY
jgi:hypothetical protein